MAYIGNKYMSNKVANNEKYLPFNLAIRRKRTTRLNPLRMSTHFALCF